MPRNIYFFFFLLLIPALTLHAQIAGGDASELIQIIRADKLQMDKVNGNPVQILAGKVEVKQGATFFSCDSCVINEASHLFEAFGHVYINDSDTTKIWSNNLRYLTDKRMAYLNGNVKLSDGKVVLTTNELEYDAGNKIGTYRNGGKVINRKTVLTSREGIYYTDIKDFYFKNNVELKDPAYTLRSDSLLYNTDLQTARFIANTYIRDSSGRVIRTKEGYYDLKSRHAEFTQRTSIQDKALTVSGDRIASDDETGITQVEGRAVLVDTAQGISLLANRIFANKKTDALLATQKPVMIIKQGKDSFFVAADTIFSARLSDLQRDTSSNKKVKVKKDSSDRYFEAYRNVKVFTDSMQAVSDSLFYSFKDSTFQLYQDPVVWSNKSQITGDTILLQTKNKKAHRFRVINNSLMVNEVQQGVYNQIKSSRMNGFFKEGVIDSVLAKGSAESVYFIQDKDSAFTSVNQTTSDAIDIMFTKGELYKVIFRTNLKGTLYPISQKEPSDMRLPNFKWYEKRRPKSKYDLFQ